MNVPRSDHRPAWIRGEFLEQLFPPPARPATQLGQVLGYFLIALGALRGSHDVGRPTTPMPVTARWTTPRSRCGQYSLATANTDHIVNDAAMLLIVVDASVVLYDLGSILKMLG